MSLFIAIELLMVMVPFLGFIPIGPLRATTLHIPVIIAAMTLGKEKGYAFIINTDNNTLPFVNELVGEDISVPLKERLK